MSERGKTGAARPRSDSPS